MPGLDQERERLESLKVETRIQALKSGFKRVCGRAWKKTLKKFGNLLTAGAIQLLSRPPREAARERQLKGRSRRKSGRLFRPHGEKLFYSVGPARLRTSWVAPRVPLLTRLVGWEDKAKLCAA